MEDSTIIHDENEKERRFDLGNGTTMPQSCVVSDSISHSTVFPVDLVNDELETAITLPSLTRLCCARITKEATFLKDDICSSLPVNLYPAVLREAIRDEFRKIAFTLMPIWPSKVISMIDVVPGVLNYFAVLVDRKFVKGCLYYPLRGIVRLVRLFFYVVKNRLTPHLRVLDLRGVALGDAMVLFLVREIISISSNVSLLDDYCIFIDCRICHSSAAEKLIDFLKTRKAKIHLHINKLDVSWLDKNKLWELLEQISPTQLSGLILRDDSASFTPSALTKFSALIALDLEIVPGNDIAISTFPLFPQLRRLRFRITWDYYSIDVIPKSTLCQLEHLTIEGGRPAAMAEINLRHLISALPLRLTEVILRGWNVSAKHLNLWKEFLLSIASTLKMLDLGGCFENNDAHFATILDYILPLVNLVFLDLSHNCMSNEILHDHIPKFNALPRLKRIVLPTHPKLYDNDEYDEDDDEEKLVTQRCKVLESKMLIGKKSQIQIRWF